MSIFYQEKKKRILKVYQYLGMGEKVVYGLFVLMMGIMVYSVYLLTNEASGNDYLLLVFLVIIFILYKILKWLGAKNSRERLKAVKEIKEDEDINIHTVKSLIKEIEDKIDRTRKFATWSVGVIVTLLVLTINIVSTGGFKVIDFLFQVSTDEEKRLFIDFLSNQLELKSMNGLYNPFYDIGLDIFMSLCLLVFMVYLVISIINLVKKEVALFLYDVKYELEKDISIQMEEGTE